MRIEVIISSSKRTRRSVFFAMIARKFPITLPWNIFKKSTTTSLAHLQYIHNQEENCHPNGTKHSIAHSFICLLFKFSTKPSITKVQQQLWKLSHSAIERKIGATETCEKGSRIRSHRPTSMDIMLTILPIVIFRRPSAFNLFTVS